MSDQSRNDPLIGSTFGFKVDGVDMAFFTGVSGISIEIETVEHKMVNQEGHQVLIKIPGRAKYSEVVLKRGMTVDNGLYDWMKQVAGRGDAFATKTAAITCYDQTYQPVATFNFEGCWPSKLSASDPTAGSDEVMVEEMTIQHTELLWA